MIVKLKHDTHGIHIAYSNDEVTRCKENGWVGMDESVLELPVVENLIKDASENAPKRRGRPRKIEG